MSDTTPVAPPPPVDAQPERLAPVVPLSSPHDGIARAATLIGLGNIASRIFGMLREMALTRYFGATGLVGAYSVASFVPQMLYDMVVGGMISSALVPVFSEYAEKGKKEIGRLAGLILSLTIISMTALASVLILAAPQIAQLIGGGLPPEFLNTSIFLLQVMAPATIFLALSGVTTALLYALRRFTLPAFVVAVFNAALVLTIVLSGGQTITYAAVGFLIGSIVQVALQLPGLRGLPLTWRVDLRHPALRRIALLYLPMLLGIAIAQFGAILDRRLASGVNEHAIAWMRYATTLQQLPQGLVATAISMAALPALARQAPDLVDFRRTLGVSLRMVLVMTIPLGLMLYLLADPIVALLFERGLFTAFDTQQTALALRIYLIGLPFAALDLPLVYAFYARGNTLTPNLVSFIGVLAYLLVALPLIGPLGFVGLVAANAAQLAAHAIAMMILAHRRFDALRGQAFIPTLAKTAVASLGLIVAIWVIQWLLRPFDLTGLVGLMVYLALTGGIGFGVFTLLAVWLRLSEVETLGRHLSSRLRRARV